jgi:hypothetical protein
MSYIGAAPDYWERRSLDDDRRPGYFNMLQPSKAWNIRRRWLPSRSGAVYVMGVASSAAIGAAAIGGTTLTLRERTRAGAGAAVMFAEA